MTPDELKKELEYRADGTLWWRTSKQGRDTYKPAGTPDKDGYTKITINGKVYRAHHLVYMYHGLAAEPMLDHINGDPSDNRIENLRPVNVMLNGANRAVNKNSSTGYRGVRKEPKGKYGAGIRSEGVFTWLGTFDNPESAAKAYNEAALRAWGEYARLNIIKENK